MPDKPRILVFAGSAREASLNKKLARVAAKVVNEQGGEALYVDLGDYPMPIYEGDLEEREGMPEAARRLRELFVSHPAFLIVSPENNGSKRSRAFATVAASRTLSTITKPSRANVSLCSCVRVNIGCLLRPVLVPQRSSVVSAPIRWPRAVSR